MNSDSTKLANAQQSGAAETREPVAGLTPAPVWLVFLFGILFYWGTLYLDRHAGEFHPKVFGPYTSGNQLASFAPKDESQLMIAKGKVVYDNACKLCHQDTGLGAPGQFPPLAGSEWVSGPAERVIRIPIHGLSGPIKVKEQDWNLSMPAIGAALSDEELANLLTYVRQAWGNKAPPVTPAQVKAVKDKTADRSQPWTAQELLQIQSGQ